MASTIIIKNSADIGQTPTTSDLVQGEIALNVGNGKLYYGTAGGTAVSSSFTFTDITASGDINASGGNIYSTRFFQGSDNIAEVYSPIAGGTGIVTTGAINAGSITSGFTSIDVGSGPITTTGIIYGGSASFSDNVWIAEGKKLIFDNEQDNDQFIKGADNYLTIESDNLLLLKADDNINVTSPHTKITGSLTVSSHITSSGDISSSGTITGNSFEIQGKTLATFNDPNMTVGQANKIMIIRGDEIRIGNDATQHITASGHISSSAASTASFGSIIADRWDYTNILATGKIASTNSNANWYVAGANGIDAGNWNADIGVATTTVNSSTATIARQPAACGIPIPFDCELIGFRALGRNNSNASNAWSASLWTYVPNHGISGVHQTMTLSAFQTASLANTGFPADATGESGSSWAGPGHATDLTRTLPLKGGSAILPALKCDDDRTDTCIISFTLVLRTKTSDIVGSEFTVVDKNN